MFIILATGHTLFMFQKSSLCLFADLQRHQAEAESPTSEHESAGNKRRVGGSTGLVVMGGGWL